MRICLIGNARAVHLQRWATAYRDAGHHVEILSIRNASIPGVPVHTVSFGPGNDPSRMWSFLSYTKLAATARRAVRRCNPDVVNPHFTITSGVFARLAGVHPIVITAWGSDVIPTDGSEQSRTMRRLNRWAIGGADRVTVASHYLAGWVQKAVPGAPVTVVPFGVDTDTFHPAASDRDPDTFSVGLVKSLEPRYGIDRAIRAMPSILERVPEAVLTIAGDGSLRKDLENLSTGLRLSEAVRFLGRVEHNEVPALMRTFDVLLNTTIVPESFGVVILEGSATGIPVVTSGVGGVGEVCVDRETALLIPPGDPDAIATAVVELAGDSDLRNRLGTAGRELVVNRFTWNDSVTRMLDVLEDAVTRP